MFGNSAKIPFLLCLLFVVTITITIAPWKIVISKYSKALPCEYVVGGRVQQERGEEFQFWWMTVETGLLVCTETLHRPAVTLQSD